MRTVTNFLMFLVALLTVGGIYLLREQSSGGLHRAFGSLLGNQRQAAKHPTPPKAGRAKPAHMHTVARIDPQRTVDVTVTVIPVGSSSTADKIQVGMAKKKLWDQFGKPDVMTSSRDSERFLETFIYLFDDGSKATVIRLVNGAVVSVQSTLTISPPLLVPQSNGLATSVSLKSDMM